jgi:glycosyltransferase involved in cell wall biosynthesis
LPNTFDEGRFRVQPRRPQLFSPHDIDVDDKVILTIGRLDASERYKGHDQLLQALPAVQAACGAVRLLIIGEGDDRGRLESMSYALGVQRSVTFCGFVPVEHLAGYYALADAFAMPSTGEGFGVVFLESMGCGTPVLAGSRDGSVDALDRGRLGLLVDPTDTRAVAAGLIALLKRQGPSWWFDRHALSHAVMERFGRAAFRSTLRQVFSS